jgi:flavin reductase (DIM6/NTAB) family NADH-FMN oxidoreductase RutF
MSDAGTASAALLRLPYGIWLVGSRDGDSLNLMTANWGTQCSFEPRLFTVFVEADARTRRLIDGGGVFSVSLLPADSEEAVNQFTKPADKVGNKLSNHEYFLAPETGAPIYGGAVAWFECRVVDSRPVGDHVQYVGEVVGGGTPSDEAAWTLQELGWEYGG